MSMAFARTDHSVLGRWWWTVDRWTLVALEWEREAAGSPLTGGQSVVEQIPFGLKVADDCSGLVENAFEKQIIITALDIAAGTAGNWVLETALQRTSQRVHEGVPISIPLAEDDIFPPMVSQMVKIGEETGELDKMLGKIADFYEDEVDASIQSLTSIIEPILMIGVGAMVGTIVISMYLPMFKLLTLIK